MRERFGFRLDRLPIYMYVFVERECVCGDRIIRRKEEERVREGGRKEVGESGRKWFHQSLQYTCGESREEPCLIFLSPIM
jgi:hypothetical protein